MSYSDYIARIQLGHQLSAALKRAEEAESRVAELETALASQQPANDGWIEWKGGDQPVEDNLLVETKWTDGSISYGEASRWRWSHKSLLSDNNLIAYRVVKP